MNDASLCLRNGSQTIRSGRQGWTATRVSNAQSHKHWLRGLHPFIVPGAADISSVTVHKHLALNQGPVLHGAGLKKKKDHFTGQKSLVVARWLE